MGSEAFLWLFSVNLGIHRRDKGFYDSTPARTVIVLPGATVSRSSISRSVLFSAAPSWRQTEAWGVFVHALVSFGATLLEQASPCKPMFTQQKSRSSCACTARTDRCDHAVAARLRFHAQRHRSRIRLRLWHCDDLACRQCRCRSEMHRCHAGSTSVAVRGQADRQDRQR